MEQESVHREWEIQSKMNPEKRVENPCCIFFLQKNIKKNNIFLFV